MTPINQLIKHAKCPECEHDLTKRDITLSDVKNLSGLELEMIEKGQSKLFECINCPYWFLYVNGHVFRYEGAQIGWVITPYKITVKERVIFT